MTSREVNDKARMNARIIPRSVADKLYRAAVILVFFAMIVVFSKDRAFQLEACLRTLFAHCGDAESVPIRVLWTASNAMHEEAYAVLLGRLRNHANLEFIRETNFRCDLVLILGRINHQSWRGNAARTLMNSPFSTLISSVVTSLLNPAPITLFVVDDTLFLKPFRFEQCAKKLVEETTSISFSLRLGEGLTHFYMGNRQQRIPDFRQIEREANICTIHWTDADGDFSYPLEISSSLLRSAFLLPRLLRKPWRSPNTLELALAHMAGRYRRDFPSVLTFREPRAVSVPLNMVQSEFTDNRVASSSTYNPGRLCELFLAGVRADLSALPTLVPTAVHMEVDLLPVIDR